MSLCSHYCPGLWLLWLYKWSLVTRYWLQFTEDFLKVTSRNFNIPVAKECIQYILCVCYLWHTLALPQNNGSPCKHWQKNTRADEHVLSLASLHDEKHYQLYSSLRHFLLIEVKPFWACSLKNERDNCYLPLNKLLIEQHMKCICVPGKWEDKFTQLVRSPCCHCDESLTSALWKREKNTHRHIEQLFHRVNWLWSDWPGLYSMYTLHVYTVGQREETDHEHTALVCDSKSMVELAAYLWPTCGWM